MMFKAQALAGGSLDDYACDSRPLDPSDKAGRAQVSEVVSAIARAGRPRIKQPGLEVIVSGSRFLAQIACEQRDEAGRGTAIVCVGSLVDSRDGQTPSEAVSRELTAFAAATSRTLDDANAAALARALDEICTERRQRRITAGLVIGSAIIALLSVATSEHAKSADGKGEPSGAAPLPDQQVGEKR